jgi:hypothetical protein
MAQRADFMLTLNASNNSDDTLDPELMAARLLVNGVASELFGDAVNIGIREERWSALPPGEEIKLQWTLGRSLFERPGAYVLGWIGGGRMSSSTLSSPNERASCPTLRNKAWTCTSSPADTSPQSAAGGGFKAERVDWATPSCT